MEHLLLVAGPGRAGKSTFMAMLASAQLSPELRALLPVGVESWPQMGTDRSKRGLRSLRSAEKLILHYDIAIKARRQQSYSGDPVLAGLQSARRVTVVQIRPSQARLVHQSSLRTAAAEARRSWWAKFWRKSALKYLFDLRKRLRRNRFPRKSLLYQQAGWLEMCYAAWDAFLQATLASRTAMEIIRLEPDGAPGSDPSFRMVGHALGKPPDADADRLPLTEMMG